MMDGILGLIGTFGYVVVFFVVMSESAGLPVPGETSLLIAAALAATGHLNIVGVILAAAGGAILGDTGGYWVGRKFGIALLRRYGAIFRFDEEKLHKAEEFFAKHGEKTVFFGRFVPVGRIFSAVLAGVGRMHYRRFLAWNASGGLVWATLMGTLGYLFGHNLPLIENIVQKGGLGLLFALIAALLARWAYLRRARIRAGLAGSRLTASMRELGERLAPLPRIWLWRWSFHPLTALAGGLVVLAVALAGLVAAVLT
jgi:membrane protein DedA with SNARE-associated domain